MAEISATRDARIQRDLGEFRPLLAASGRLPARFLGDEDRVLALALAEVESRLHAGARRISPPGADALLCDLPWESQLLERRMAALEYICADDALAASTLVHEAITAARAEGVEFLLCKVFTDDHNAVQALTGAGFRLVETVLLHTFAPPSPFPVIGPGPPLVRRADLEDCDAAVAVARAAFENHFGRFHSDPGFSRSEALKVYEEWVRASFRGYGDAIFVAEDDSRIVGFSVWRDPSANERAAGISCAHFSIGGVHPAAARRGTIGALTAAGMAHYQGRADQFDGPTHIRNLAIHRAYASLGWLLRDSQYTFHLWTGGAPKSVMA